MDPFRRYRSKLYIYQIEIELLVLVFVLIGLVFIKSGMEFFVFTNNHGIVSNSNDFSLLCFLDQFNLFISLGPLVKAMTVKEEYHQLFVYLDFPFVGGSSYMDVVKRFIGNLVDWITAHFPQVKFSLLFARVVKLIVQVDLEDYITIPFVAYYE